MQLDNDIHNYYEKLVVEAIIKYKLDVKYNTDKLADFCCIVLNQLPARYIRYNVDMAFYLPQEERLSMEKAVKEAIDIASKKIDEKK